MKTKTKKVGNVLVVTVAEERLDARTASDLKSTVLDCIEGGETRIVLDLSTIDFVDSTGLGAIVLTRKAIGGSGEIVMTGINDSVMRMFRLTRTDTLFRIAATDEEAIGFFETDFPG